MAEICFLMVSILSTSSSTSPRSSVRFLFDDHVALLQKWSKKLPDRLNQVWWLLLPNAGMIQGRDSVRTNDRTQSALKLAPTPFGPGAVTVPLPAPFSRVSGLIGDPCRMMRHLAPGIGRKPISLRASPNDLSPSVGVGSDVSGLPSFPATSCLPGRGYLHPDLVHAFEAVLTPCVTAVSTVAPAQAVARRAISCWIQPERRRTSSRERTYGAIQRCNPWGPGTNPRGATRWPRSISSATRMRGAIAMPRP
jgi:hypothetical protein